MDDVLTSAGPLDARRHDPPTRPLASGVVIGDALRALGSVVALVVVVLGASVAAHAADLVDLRRPVVLIAVLTAMTGAAAAGLLLVVRRRQVSPAAVGFARPRWRLLHLLWQIPALVVVAATVQAVGLLVTRGTALRPADRGGGLPDLDQLPVALVGVVLLVAAILTPLWEEVLFRGLILSGLASRCGQFLAVALTALVFAAVHVAPPVMPYVFVLGVGLGLIRWFHRNLWASIVAHAVNNALAVGLVVWAPSAA